MSKANGLNDAQTERLALLAEEAAEVIQVVGKILRHGWESRHPTKDLGTNKERLESELGDMAVIVGLLAHHDEVNLDSIGDASEDKFRRIQKHLHEDHGDFFEEYHPAG